MKIRCIALAVLSMTVCGMASAQSNVTLFGVIDSGVRHVNNTGAGSLTAQSTNGLQTSRFGFRGEEDLGGGLQAGFWLESGFLPDTGAQIDSTRFFGRRSTVSLKSNSLGEIRLGRDYTPTYSALFVADSFLDFGMGAITNITSALGSGAQTLFRADNSVSYFLPQIIPGVTGQLMVAAAEGTTGNKYAGGNLGYASGPLRIIAGYGETTVANDNKFKFGTVSANYDFSVVKLYGGLSQSKYLANKQNVYQFGLTAPLGHGTLKTSVTRGDMSGPRVAGAAISNADDATKLAIGYAYDLSKRTTLYAFYAQIKNDGASALRIPGGPGSISAGGTSRGVDFGIRHIF